VIRLISALGLAWFAASATAGEPWVYIGDLQLASIRTPGKLSLNLDTLRRRSTHYEIWERLVFNADPADPAMEEAPARHTLWAIRCRSGAMAKVTERIAGAVEPRAEVLRFYVPTPASSGAAIIETTCLEVRRRANENPRPTPEGSLAAQPGLAAPPSIFDGDSFADDDD
jgi:hypothetical protein